MKFWRARCALDGRPRELRGADAGGDAVLGGGGKHHRQPRIPLREEPRMKTPGFPPRSSACCWPRCRPRQGAAAAARSAVVVTGVDVQLLDQASKRQPMAARSAASRGLWRSFYTSCQYICPLIVEQRRRPIEHALTPAEQTAHRDHPDAAWTRPATRRRPLAAGGRQAQAGHAPLDAGEPAQGRRAPGSAGVLGVGIASSADGEFQPQQRRWSCWMRRARCWPPPRRWASQPDPEFVAEVRPRLAA